MMPGIDPSKMKAMMKQMGIKQEEIEANRVIIEREDGNVIIENPSVTKIDMKGNVSWQISGDETVEEIGIKESDIDLVMEKTGATKNEAKKALEDADGDLTEAILILSS